MHFTYILIHPTCIQHSCTSLCRQQATVEADGVWVATSCNLQVASTSASTTTCCCCALRLAHSNAFACIFMHSVHICDITHMCILCAFTCIREANAKERTLRKMQTELHSKGRPRNAAFECKPSHLGCTWYFYVCLQCAFSAHPRRRDEMQTNAQKMH